MKDNRVVGLALGSGGPRGLAHIGVIKALEEYKVPIDIVAGTSVGSLIGGLYLSLGSIEAVEEIFTKLKITDLAAMFSDFGLKSGIIKGNKLEEFLEKYIGESLIENLPKPYGAIATNISSAEDVVIQSGRLTKAIRASSSLPGVMNVANFEGNYLIDGGVSQPVPIRVARMLGADRVIAINLDQYSQITNNFTANMHPSATKIALTAIKLLRYSLAQEQCRDADIVINPDVAEIAWGNLTYERDRIDIIKRGYDAAIAKMNDIQA